MLPAPECAKTSARYAGDCMICAAVESAVILDIQADIGLQRYWKVLRNVTARLWRHEHVRYYRIDYCWLAIMERGVLLKKTRDVGSIFFG